MIAQLVKPLENDTERAPPVVTYELFYVLEKNIGCLMMLQDALDFEEHRATCVGKSLHLTHYAEGLAGESCQ